MKLIIAGSRQITDKEFVINVIDETVKRLNLDVTEVIEGECRGPDLFGKEWANRHGIPVNEFPADWEKYGRRAGPIRNSEMAKVGDMLIAFLSKGSIGTQDMINKMRAKGKPICIVDETGVRFNNEKIDDIWV